MIIAQIKDNIIMHTLVLDDISLLPLFNKDPLTGIEYDTLLQIENIYPRPGIGWYFDGLIFKAPITLELEVEESGEEE